MVEPPDGGMGSNPTLPLNRVPYSHIRPIFIFREEGHMVYYFIYLNETDGDIIIEPVYPREFLTRLRFFETTMDRNDYAILAGHEIVKPFHNAGMDTKHRKWIQKIEGERHERLQNIQH